MGFEWDVMNTKELAKSQRKIKSWEVEDAECDEDWCFIGTYADDTREIGIGKTQDERYIFMIREYVGDHIRILTAREAAPDEKQRYMQRNCKADD